MRTPGVQTFVGYKKSKWGTVPPNGVQMATLALSYVGVYKGAFFIHLYHSFKITTATRRLH